MAINSCIPQKLESKACTVPLNNYRIAPNFQGTNFSRICLLQIFAEINFVDEEFSLATPTLGSRMYYSCRFVPIRGHNAILSCSFASRSKRFCSGKLRLEPSRFRSLELTNYASQARDACPLTNAMDVEGTYEGGPQGSGSVRFKTTIECHIALDVHAIAE